MRRWTAEQAHAYVCAALMPQDRESPWCMGVGIVPMAVGWAIEVLVLRGYPRPIRIPRFDFPVLLRPSGRIVAL